MKKNMVVVVFVCLMALFAVMLMASGAMAASVAEEDAALGAEVTADGAGAVSEETGVESDGAGVVSEESGAAVDETSTASDETSVAENVVTESDASTESDAEAADAAGADAGEPTEGEAPDIAEAVTTEANLSDTESDISGHWAEETLREWIYYEMISGYEDGNYRPDNSITRAEFIRLINLLGGFVDVSGGILEFSDVPQDEWYYDEIAAAITVGYINGTSETTMSPEDPITREQAIAIISRLCELDEDEGIGVLDRVSDGDSVSEWAIASVSAAIYAGFITGNDGFINPTSFITRAEAVVLLDRIRLDARVFGFPGIYGPASGVYSIMGDVTITSSEVTLRNFEFQQNIHITSNVSDGVITIMNSQLSGGMYVEGGGPGGVHLINSLIEGAAIFKDGIRVLLSDGALIGIMYVESERVRVVLDNDAIIEGLGIFADQVSIDVSESAYAVEIYIEANNTTISGTGKIDHVIVEGGQGNVVTVSGAFVEVGDNAGPVDFGDGNATSSRDADMNDEASDINDLDNTSDSENNENPVDAENVENVVNTDDADDGTNTGD